MSERTTSAENRKNKDTLFEKIKRFFAVLIKGEGVSAGERKSVRETLLFSIFSMLLSFVFARCELLFGQNSLIIALASAVSGPMSVPIFIGAILSSLLSIGKRALQAVALSLILAGRILLRYSPGSRGLFREPVSVRVALSVSLAFTLSLYGFIASGFDVSSVYAMLFMVSSAPVLTFFIAPAFDRSEGALLRDAGFCILLFFTVYSLHKNGLFGFSLGIILSFLVIFSIASSKETLRATVAGVLCGLAIGVTYVPVMAAAGLSAGLLSGTNMKRAVGFSSAIAIVASVYIKGYTAIFGFMGDAVISSIIFLALYRVGAVPELSFFKSADIRADLRDERRHYEKSRLAALSSAFDELSDELLEISRCQKKPSERELRDICEGVCSVRCTKCKNSSLCWNTLFNETSALFDSVAHTLKEKGSVGKDDLTESFMMRCLVYEEILLDINCEVADRTESAIKKDKTELFALDYEAMAELLGNEASDSEGVFENDQALSHTAGAVLRTLGISAMGYTAKGRRVKTVVASGIAIGSLNVSGRDIKTALEKATGIPFHEPHFDFCGELVNMTISSKEKISVSCAYRVRGKDEFSLCGDVVKVFDCDSGKTCAVICDGMGSGRIAAVTAKISAVFLEKMISAGNSKDTVLKMLSNFIRSKSEECSSTADIAEVDLYLSEIVFTKCGAAISYILSGERIYKASAHSLPIGVTKAIDPEEKRFSLKVGDVIVMTSDGIAESFEDSLWLPDLLGECSGRSSEEIADAIMERALWENSSDDMSVVVMTVGEV